MKYPPSSVCISSYNTSSAIVHDSSSAVYIDSLLQQSLTEAVLCELLLQQQERPAPPTK